MLGVCVKRLQWAILMRHSEPCYQAMQLLPKVYSGAKVYVVSKGLLGRFEEEKNMH